MTDFREQLSFHTSFHYVNPRLPLLMVPVKVNGAGPYEFILDTGNARYPFLLSPGLADEIGLDTGDFTVATGYTVGLDSTARVGRIDSVEVAGISVANPCVAISPALEQLQNGLTSSQPQTPIRIDGNIGYPFLKDYTLDFDFAQSLLTLCTSRNSRAVIPFVTRDTDPLIVIEAFACEQPFKFVLDTGASATCISEECAGKLELERGAVSNLNMSGDSKGFMTRLPSLRVGDRLLQDLTVVAADFLDGLSEEMGIKVDGILGHNFWGRFRLIIDYPGHKIGL